MEQALDQDYTHEQLVCRRWGISIRLENKRCRRNSIGQRKRKKVKYNHANVQNDGFMNIFRRDFQT